MPHYDLEYQHLIKSVNGTKLVWERSKKGSCKRYNVHSTTCNDTYVNKWKNGQNMVLITPQKERVGREHLFIKVETTFSNGTICQEVRPSFVIADLGEVLLSCA